MPKTLSVWIVLLYFSSPHYSFSSPHLPEAPSVGVLFFVVVLHSCTFLWYHLWLSPPLSLWGMTGSYGGIWGGHHDSLHEFHAVMLCRCMQNMAWQAQGVRPVPVARFCLVAASFSPWSCFIHRLQQAMALPSPLWNCEHSWYCGRWYVTPTLMEWCIVLGGIGLFLAGSFPTHPLPLSIFQAVFFCQKWISLVLWCVQVLHTGGLTGALTLAVFAYLSVC